ncbi:MAG: GNAT family N-acetyltransferase [Clostridia bacterium]|nr:GNAT family N-acetyltransferase [Clostridia bacterium]
MPIEKADRADIPALVDLRLAYLREDRGGLDAGDAQAVADRLPAYFAAHLGKDLCCYIKREGSEIVSCAFLLTVEKPMSPAFPNGKTGVVLNVYTKRPFRRRGYAKRILEALIADAQAMDISPIELKATEAGYPLYRAVGFRDDDSPYRRMKWEKQSDDTNI